MHVWSTHPPVHFLRHRFCSSWTLACKNRQTLTSPLQPNKNRTKCTWCVGEQKQLGDNADQAMTLTKASFWSSPIKGSSSQNRSTDNLSANVWLSEQRDSPADFQLVVKTLLNIWWNIYSEYMTTILSTSFAVHISQLCCKLEGNKTNLNSFSKSFL